MWWRTLLGAIALASVGVTAGVVLGSSEPVPRDRVPASPLGAVSPSRPTDLPILVLPDPTSPPLPTGLPLKREQVGDRPFALTVKVPRGWRRTNPTSGQWGWSPPAGDLFTHFIRVRLVGNQFQSVSAAVANRIAALESAEGVLDLEVQSRTADTLVVTYVTEEHRRVAMEHYVTNGSDTAYAVVAVVGRESDRAGLSDLLDRLSRSATPTT